MVPQIVDLGFSVLGIARKGIFMVMGVVCLSFEFSYE